MKRFPKEFKYLGFTIRKTSFNWRVVELDTLVESYQDAKDLIDRTRLDEKREDARVLLKIPTVSISPEVEEELSKAVD